MTDVLDPREVKTFFPFVGALFVYIFVSNLLGLIPGLLPPTDNVNNNVGMAFGVFLLFNFVGLSRDPVGYIKHLWGPVWWLGVLMFPIELISLLFRPVSLTLRLTGNLFGDHLVFNIMSGLAPALVPVAFLLLGSIVAVMQAFVFALLTSIYISLSLPHHEHDEGQAHAH